MTSCLPWRRPASFLHTSGNISREVHRPMTCWLYGSTTISRRRSRHGHFLRGIHQAKRQFRHRLACVSPSRAQGSGHCAGSIFLRRKANSAKNHRAKRSSGGWRRFCRPAAHPADLDCFSRYLEQTIPLRVWKSAMPISRPSIRASLEKHGLSMIETKARSYPRSGQMDYDTKCELVPPPLAVLQLLRTW